MLSVECFHRLRSAYCYMGYCLQAGPTQYTLSAANHTLPCSADLSVCARQELR